VPLYTAKGVADVLAQNTGRNSLCNFRVFPVRWSGYRPELCWLLPDRCRCAALAAGAVQLHGGVRSVAWLSSQLTWWSATWSGAWPTTQFSYSGLTRAYAVLAIWPAM